MWDTGRGRSVVHTAILAANSNCSASMYSTVSVIKRLLACGVDVNAVDDRLGPPLFSLSTIYSLIVSFIVSMPLFGVPACLPTFTSMCVMVVSSSCGQWLDAASLRYERWRG